MPKKKTKKVKKDRSVEALIEETNDLLKKQMILQLAMQKVPKQAIRKVVGGAMNDITNFLKPLKGKIDI